MNQSKIDITARLLLNALDQWEHILIDKDHLAKPSIKDLFWKDANSSFDCVICGEKIKSKVDSLIPQLMSVSKTMTPEERYAAVDKFFRDLERRGNQ